MQILERELVEVVPWEVTTSELRMEEKPSKVAPLTTSTVREDHFRGGWEDRSMIAINSYNEHGLRGGYFWERVFLKPAVTNEDVEKARLEACKELIRGGGYVIITLLDSLAIPENDRNAPIDMRNPRVIGHVNGWDRYAKERNGRFR